MTDKVIVTHEGNLNSKYGAGTATVHAAVACMIANDSVRGLSTKYIRLDVAADMGAYGAPISSSGPSEADFKDAIDQVWSAEQPQYLMLLGASDVLPHQTLANPLPRDPDKGVPSDLPYACSAPFGTQIAAFAAPTRVVGRLPDIVGASNPDQFAELIHRVSTSAPAPVSHYRTCFAVGAEVWKASTALSIANTFGSVASVHQCPPEPAGTGWPPADLGAKSHFYNCHGAARSPKFFGQNGLAFPTAMESSWLAGQISPGTVVTAECCYGAQLFAPSAPSSMPICSRYMHEGASGYVGSTNIAYGPAIGNGQADLICQYFFQHLLRGASLGRALLAARLSFVGSSSVLSAVDQKTLAQFLLFGDPSAQVVANELEMLEAPSSETKRALRRDNRDALASFAEGLASGVAAAIAREEYHSESPSRSFDSQAQDRVRQEIGTEVAIVGRQKFVALNPLMKSPVNQTIVVGEVAGADESESQIVLFLCSEDGSELNIRDVYYSKSCVSSAR